MWFVFALVTILAWGGADLYYKKAAEDRYSPLKTAMVVGLVMGLHAIATLLFGDFAYDPINLLLYLPVSLMYIGSMTVGYLGLKYLKLSISSPIQNSSGAVTCLLCWLVLGQSMDGLSLTGTALICVGVLMLGVLEHREDASARLEDKKYRAGFWAFWMPVLYCVIDAMGTFLDAYYLDDVATTPLRGVTETSLENVANVSYELTFLICAVLIFVYLFVIRREKLSLPAQKDRGIAAVMETAGQATYVYAMSGNGIVAAPMIASYSIVSLLLSRLFLKERLTRGQYVVIAVVMVGVVLLGLAEGLGG